MYSSNCRITRKNELRIKTPVSLVSRLQCDEPDMFGRHIAAVIADRDNPDWTVFIDDVTSWLEYVVDDPKHVLDQVVQPANDFDIAAYNLTEDAAKIQASSKRWVYQGRPLPVLRNSGNTYYEDAPPPGMMGSLLIDFKPYSFVNEEGETLVGVSGYLSKIRVFDNID